MTRKSHRRRRPRPSTRPLGLIMGGPTRGASAQPAERVAPWELVACEDGKCPFCEVLEQWICHCGAINENNRAVCRWCGCLQGRTSAG
jgi:hypothetical protein